MLPESSHDNKAGKLKLYAANHTESQTYGNKNIKISLGLERAFDWSFIVADIKTAIIGADFLAHHNLLIDLTERRLVDATTQKATPGKISTTPEFGISTINPTMPYSSLLQQYIGITKPATKPKVNNTDYCHRIITNRPPVTERCRELAGEKASAAQAEIQALLDNGVIRPSITSYSRSLPSSTQKDHLFNDRS